MLLVSSPPCQSRRILVFSCNFINEVGIDVTRVESQTQGDIERGSSGVVSKTTGRSSW